MSIFLKTFFKKLFWKRRFSLTFDDPKVWRQLKSVNLSNCEIATLPEELGALPNLERLLLSNCNLGASNGFKWHWLQQTAIQNNLRVLDMSNNSLTVLPTYIGKLSALRVLIVSRNSLTSLPQSIVNLRNLTFLGASNNKLLYLPGSMLNMQLETLDVLANDFFKYEITLNHMQLLSLRSLTAKVILKNRLAYDSSLLPLELAEYLEQTEYCLFCKNACFESYITKFVQRQNSINIVATMRVERHKTLSFECYFCSLDCYEIWKICNIDALIYTW